MTLETRDRKKGRGDGGTDGGGGGSAAAARGAAATGRVGGGEAGGGHLADGHPATGNQQVDLPGCAPGYDAEYVAGFLAATHGGAPPPELAAAVAAAAAAAAVEAKDVLLGPLMTEVREVFEKEVLARLAPGLHRARTGGPPMAGGGGGVWAPSRGKARDGAARGR
jgi:hypothetical protein